MAKQTINIGTVANDGTGDPLRTSFGKINSNFDELFANGNNVAVVSSKAYDKANSANVLAYNTGIGTNAFASATIAGANTAVGSGANANAAIVGTSANAFAAATISGANSYLLATLSGANSYLLVTIAGANTAVGNGANANAAIVGTSANAFAATTIAGANSFLLAVITGANTTIQSAYDRANSTLQLINVKDFGAVGDGSTDDTTAIQDAIDYAISINRPLFIPNGVYVVSSVSVADELNILGASKYKSILKAKDSVSLSNKLLSITNKATKVTIKDLTFDGNEQNQVANTQLDSIYITSEGASNSNAAIIVIDHCIFANSGHHAIYYLSSASSGNVANTKEQLFVTNCKFIDGRDSFEYSTNDYNAGDILIANQVEVYVENNDFTNTYPPAAASNGRYAIACLTTQTSTVYPAQAQILNNRVYWRGCGTTQGIGAIDMYMWVDNSIIRGNILKDSKWVAIKSKQHGKNLIVSENIIDGTTYVNRGYGANEVMIGISINGAIYPEATNAYAEGTTVIVNNIISNLNYANNGIAIDGGKEGYRGNTYVRPTEIRGNYIHSCLGMEEMISADYCENINISDNRLMGGKLGISISTSNGFCKIQNNSLQDQTNYSIYVDNNPGSGANTAKYFDVMIDGNMIANNQTTYAIYTEGRSVSLRGNSFRDVVNGCRIGTAAGQANTVHIMNNLLYDVSGTVGFNVCGDIRTLTAIGNAALDSNGTPVTYTILENTTQAINRVVTGNH